MRRPLPALEAPARGQVFGDAELVELEREHAEGVSTQEVVELFASKGAPLSEASFRKYVQLGLLPRSVRVGRKGKNRGSQGLYPATVVRQIELIRRLMAQGYTIQELQRELVFLGSGIDELSKQLERVLDGIAQTLQQRSDARGADDVLVAALADARALSTELVEKLRGIERSLAMRARMARAAV